MNTDFGVAIKGRLVALEAKYQIPKMGSEAMERLIQQVKLAAASGKEVIIFSGKELGHVAKANREKLIRELSDAQNAPIKIIGGFVGLAQWIATEALEECID